MSNSTGRRIPSLDGVRAISILMVCYGHLSGTRHFPVSITAYGRWCGDVAHLGVLVFFVISGFMITSLLISEREMTGAISLKRFYLRRIVRIFPAFYAFILVMAIATLLGVVHLSGRDFAYALTYTVNVELNRVLQIGHLWSLSVEEQFYLLWPLTLLVLRERRALFVAVAAIFIGPSVRVAIREWIFRVDPHARNGMLTSFPAMFDYLAAGCALALLRPWLLTRIWYLRLTASLAVPLVLLIAWAAIPWRSCGGRGDERVHRVADRVEYASCEFVGRTHPELEARGLSRRAELLAVSAAVAFP